MFSEGVSEHPLLRYCQIKGLAVGLVKRYPCVQWKNHMSPKIQTIAII